MTEASQPLVPHPAMDVVTAERAVMFSNRPVVGLSSWLADALAWSVRNERIATLVTGPATRVTPAVRSLVMAQALAWAVQLPDGRWFDAIDGAPLQLADGRFTGVAGPPAPEFTTFTDDDARAAAWQVVVSLTVEHRADVHTVAGRAIATVSRVLTGGEPTGWGASEPVTEPWAPEELTAFARRRIPEATQLIVTREADDGPALVASVVVQRTERGVEEQISALVGMGSLSAPGAYTLPQLRQRCRDALAAVAEQEVVGFGWTHVRPGRADLTEVARERAAPEPTALLIGPRAVRALGADRLRAGPVPDVRAVGRPRVPALLWVLGGDQVAGWDQLTAFVQHLGPDRIVAVSPAFAEALGITVGRA